MNQERNKYICELLERMVNQFSDLEKESHDDCLKWMKLSIDVMRSRNNETSVEQDTINFPACMLLNVLKQRYGLDKEEPAPQLKGILKTPRYDDSKYPIKSVKFSLTIDDTPRENPPEEKMELTKSDLEDGTATFGNITFMDDKGQQFANFFSDI